MLCLETSVYMHGKKSYKFMLSSMTANVQYMEETIYSCPSSHYVPLCNIHPSVYFFTLVREFRGRVSIDEFAYIEQRHAEI